MKMSRKIYITEAQLKHLMRVKINEEQINEENLINNFVDALNKGSYEIDGRNYEATTRRIDGTMDLLVVFDEEKDIYDYMRIEYHASINVFYEEGDYWTPPSQEITFSDTMILGVELGDENKLIIRGKDLQNYPELLNACISVAENEIDELKEYGLEEDDDYYLDCEKY